MILYTKPPMLISLIKNNGNLLIRVAKGHRLITGTGLIKKSMVAGPGFEPATFELWELGLQ